MSEPFLGEVSIFGFDFPPRSWARCDGQILPINQNQSLYSLLGTTYGGDGRTSFALPDLRGRAPVHRGATVGLGGKGGEEAVVLTQATMPSAAPHVHMQGTSDQATETSPTGHMLASKPFLGKEIYTPVANRTPLATDLSVGGSAHNNMQPYLVINFCIALTGLFPSRN